MSQTDDEFRESHKPLHVPAAYDQAVHITDKIVFALAAINEGTADEVIRKIEQLEPEADHKPVIAATRQSLTDLFDKGLIAGTERDGNLIFNLHKIVRANEGSVNPDLLAPGLD